MTTLKDFLTNDWINPFQLCHIVDRDTNVVFTDCICINDFLGICEDSKISLDGYYVYDVYVSAKFFSDKCVKGVYEIQVSKE